MKKLSMIAAFALCNLSPLQADTITLFRAELRATNVVPQLPNHSLSTATGTATFVLTQPDGNPAETTLSYDIQLNGLDVRPSDMINLNDDVTALHIHDTTVCGNAALCGGVANPTAGTRHVLNILEAPREDDADVLADGVAETVSGLWDAGDATPLPTNLPLPSQSIADPAILNLLFAGDLFVMVHSNFVPSGEIGGFLVQVPEPAGLSLLVLGSMVFFLRSRQSSPSLSLGA